MDKDKELKECCRYFEESPVMRRLLVGFREKYASLGTIGGRVVLTALSRDDIEVLEGFFGKSFHGRKNISISASGFKQALANSRFSNIAPEQLLAYYFKGNLKSKKEIRQEEESAKEALFDQVLAGIFETRAAAWIKSIREERTSAYQIVVRRYQMDRKGAYNLLRLTAEALNSLPVYQEKLEYLAVFSARVTGNPHYFDEGNEANPLLSAGIQMLLGQQPITAGDGVFPAFVKQKLFLNAGILKDDISNYTVAYGLHAWKADGSVHDGIEGYWRCQESIHLSLQVVAGLGRVSCEEGAVYVFENPSVYAVLTGMADNSKSFFCMNGQPNMAAILLLDLLAEGGAVIYYAGDFDPEGLWIAQRLKLRYGKQLCFMAMDCEHYEKVLSPVMVDEKRLKVLERLEDAGLKSVSRCMREKGRAGYQEGLLADYCEMLQLGEKSGVVKKEC